MKTALGNYFNTSEYQQKKTEKTLDEETGQESEQSVTSTLEQLSPVQPLIAGFVLNQVVDCYANLGSWEEVIAWQQEHESTDFSLPQPAIASSYDPSLAR